MTLTFDIDLPGIYLPSGERVERLYLSAKNHIPIFINMKKVGSAYNPPGGSTLTLTLRPPNQVNGTLLALLATTDLSGNQFTGEFSTNTSNLDTWLGGEERGKNAQLLFQLATADETIIIASRRIEVTIIPNMSDDGPTPDELPSLIANQAEAEAGTSNVKLMTPLRTKQAVSYYGQIKTTVPTTKTDFSMLPGASPPSGGASYFALGLAHRYDVTSVETEWTRTIRGSW